MTDQIDQTDHIDLTERSPSLALSRRALVVRSVAAAVAAGGSVGAAALVLANDDDYDDHDEDNSGRGNADDRDDGSNDDNHGDDHDDVDDHDDSDDHGGDPHAQPAAVGVTEVQIVDEVFVPNHIAIETGQTVTWTNLDDDDHTASGRGMDTGPIRPGRTGSVTFLEPGEYDYTCNFHPEMRGLVVVTGPSLATPEASPIALPMTASVDIVDLAFDPAEVIVAVGAEVTWTNTGEIPHTVTGDFADSDIMDPGTEFTFTFDEPGIYDYACLLHPGMTGTIEVREQSADATPTAAAESEVAVDIIDFAFDPFEVTVARGGSVTWTNTGAVPHTVRGDFGDSNIMDPGAVITFTFDDAGTFPYICGLHPSMEGTVIVVDQA